MLRGTRLVQLGLFICFLVGGSAKPADGQASFEVASVKPATAEARGSMDGGPGTSDPTLFTAPSATLQNLLMFAYDVRAYQIVGPAWLSAERYAIRARVPARATTAALKVMLQQLLAERFVLVLHHETRAIPTCELVVAKNGPKLQRATVTGGPPGPAGSGLTFDKDGVPLLPPGKPRLISLAVRGQIYMVGRAETISAFAEMLKNQLRQPLIDKTGLEGRYDFTLVFTPDYGGGQPSGASNETTTDPSSLGAVLEPPTSVFSAIQEQLGLKLEIRRNPLDVIVVDRAQRVPVEN